MKELYVCVKRHAWIQGMSTYVVAGRTMRVCGNRIFMEKHLHIHTRSHMLATLDDRKATPFCGVSALRCHKRARMCSIWLWHRHVVRMLVLFAYTNMYIYSQYLCTAHVLLIYMYSGYRTIYSHRCCLICNIREYSNILHFILPFLRLRWNSISLANTHIPTEIRVCATPWLNVAELWECFSKAKKKHKTVFLPSRIRFTLTLQWNLTPHRVCN